MNETCNIFLELLRAGLWGKTPSLEYFPIHATLWNKIYRMACVHTVEGIVYEGCIRLPIDYLPPASLLIKWTVRVDRLENRNRRMNKVIEELNELFTSNGLNVFLMKGQGVAACYNDPLRRVCGDVDFCFTRAHFIEANRLIANKGITVRHQAGFSTFYQWKGIEVEHHYRLLDLHNPFLNGYVKRLQEDEVSRIGSISVKEGKVQLPSPLLMHIQVNAHILKHMLSFGIGLRQLCDSARVCYVYRDIDKEKLKEVYYKVGVFRWMQVLNSVLVAYLGLSSEIPVSLTPQGIVTQRMMEDVLLAGNFGFYDKALMLSVKRKKPWKQIMLRSWAYAPYAFSEAFWFPVMQSYSHVMKWMAR